jgi:hypothetical protein
MQEEGEAVLVKYRAGRGRGCPGEIPSRKRKRVFLVKYHAG